MSLERLAFVTTVSEQLAALIQQIFQETGKTLSWMEMDLSDGTHIIPEADKWDFRFRFEFGDPETDDDATTIYSTWFNYHKV